MRKFLVCGLFISYLVLSFFVFNWLNNEDMLIERGIYGRCLKHCNETSTICHIEVTDTVIPSIYREREEQTVYFDNVTVLYSEMYPDDRYYSIGKEDKTYVCYHDKYKKPEDNCYCLMSFSFIANLSILIWVVGLFIFPTFLM
ncbi:hypothetical protein BH23THE1_BH23THE1_29170 [soil metagenome]